MEHTAPSGAAPGGTAPGGAAGDAESFAGLRPQLKRQAHRTPVVGITGTGGSGKSSLIDELIRRFLETYADKSVAIVSVDPSRSRSGGALLGDRIRMNAIDDPRVYMRSMATRLSGGELSAAIDDTLLVLQAARFDLIIVETSGIGQGDAAIAGISDVSLYVMTSDYGAPSQLEKVDMLDYADLVVINKFEHKGALDALRDVRKQYQRNHELFDIPSEELPIIGTVASRFDDAGVDDAFARLVQILDAKGLAAWPAPAAKPPRASASGAIVPAARQQYLREIAEAVRAYHAYTEKTAAGVSRAAALNEAMHDPVCSEAARTALKPEHDRLEGQIAPADRELLKNWHRTARRYGGKTFSYQVRDKKLTVPLVRTSLAGLDIPRVALPRYRDEGELYRWLRRENLPGNFPYTAGVFPFKRDWEDPKRQFAGEGTPERTNRRFHYLCDGDDARRLSTAFDSVTLYGCDPDERPDIFGKIGESGVSVCTLDDMRKLYAGFDLCAPETSVSMTINGPAPIMAAMFFNTAIEQQLERFRSRQGREPSESESNALRAQVLQNVRGTVQADILKEDQGQNTCILSTEFALKMMGDIQEYFIQHRIDNFYSVSISGYHIAEAGANPISQLAFTLANGFTYVEYYRARGMDINAFARNFSFFFSSGMDAEYSVLARVARRIWAIALRDLYGADELARKLKCHVQTSGRSLHSQEMQFNDIRTTLQALTALSDNCNSLHTNAYDEAVTTPTEESVRRAMAIQMIINHEFGPSKNENAAQGSFFLEWLTDAVEEAVLQEFERLSERKGVLGAMESHYQRGRIQDESLHYEHLKHSGKLPVIGVNTFLAPAADQTDSPRGEIALTRATPTEKRTQIENLQAFQARNKSQAPQALERLNQVATSGGNIFAELMNTVRYASLGQITRTLYEVGGQYRRNM